MITQVQEQIDSLSSALGVADEEQRQKVASIVRTCNEWMDLIESGTTKERGDSIEISLQGLTEAITCLRARIPELAKRSNRRPRAVRLSRFLRLRTTNGQLIEAMYNDVACLIRQANLPSASLAA